MSHERRRPKISLDRVIANRGLSERECRLFAQKPQNSLIYEGFRDGKQLVNDAEGNPGVPVSIRCGAMYGFAAAYCVLLVVGLGRACHVFIRGHGESSVVGSHQALAKKNVDGSD